MIKQAKLFLPLLLMLSPLADAESGSIVLDQTVRNLNSGDILNWSMGLVVVLMLFFLCVFIMRKANQFSVTGGGKLSVIGGLTLGMREKIILLQVGNKQLLLGVTPGKMKTLLVLEGDDCLHKEKQDFASDGKATFAKKLYQAMQVKVHD